MVRGVALRGLRDAVLRHYNAEPSAAAGVLHINMYTQASIGGGGVCSFASFLKEVLSDFVLNCVDVDALESFSASAHAISSAHLHVVPSVLSSALMLVLARESSVVFCVHASNINPESVAPPLQLLSDLPWLHITHAWDNDKLLHVKLHEAVADAAIRCSSPITPRVYHLTPAAGLTCLSASSESRSPHFPPIYKLKDRAKTAAAQRQ